jgi:hypothetical protein
MTLKRTGTVMVAVLALAAPVAAQGGRPQSSAQVDISRLPLDLARIERQLRQSASTTETRDGLNLRYEVQVFGRAPELRIFLPGENLTTGPVPYGAPTHREMIEHITPQEFRSPVMDFNGLIRWLAEKSKK